MSLACSDSCELDPLYGWKSLTEKRPAEGEYAYVLLSAAGRKEPDLPVEQWKVVPATFCDGWFYTLDYEPIVGCLQKNVVTNKVKGWCSVTVPDWKSRFL